MADTKPTTSATKRTTACEVDWDQEPREAQGLEHAQQVGERTEQHERVTHDEPFVRREEVVFAERSREVVVEIDGVECPRDNVVVEWREAKRCREPIERARAVERQQRCWKRAWHRRLGQAGGDEGEGPGDRRRGRRRGCRGRDRAQGARAP